MSKAKRAARQEKRKTKKATKKTTKAAKKKTRQDKRKAMFDKMKANVKKKGLKVLTPFKGVMVKILNKRNLPVSKSDSIEKIATLFHDAVVVGKQSFNLSMYDLADPLMRYNLMYQKQGYAPYEALVKAKRAARENVIEDVNAIAGIVQSILDYFKKAKDKETDGSELTDEDRLANSETDAAANTEDKKATKKGGLLGFFKRLFGG